MRPLHQSRQVGHDEGIEVARRDDPEHRLQGRERVVPHPRRRVRQPPQQRRLPDVRQAHQAHVREQLQRQAQGAFFPLRPRRGDARRPPRRALEVDVPLPAATAARHAHAFPGCGQVGQRAPRGLVLDDRAGGDEEHAVGPVLSEHLPRLPTGAVPRREALLVPEAQERVHVRVDLEHDIPAVPPVAAVRAPFRDELLPPEGDAPVPPTPRPHADARLVDEHVSPGDRPGPRRPAAAERGRRLSVGPRPVIVYVAGFVPDEDPSPPPPFPGFAPPPVGAGFPPVPPPAPPDAPTLSALAFALYSALR